MNRDVLKQVARESRKNLTAAEAKLWDCLRDRRFEFRKFVRQKVFENYRVDFYSHSELLVIELDGTSHDSEETRASDAIRTEWLEARGLRVLRFRNEDVMDKLERVLESIKQHFEPFPK